MGLMSLCKWAILTFFFLCVAGKIKVDFSGLSKSFYDQWIYRSTLYHVLQPLTTRNCILMMNSRARKGFDFLGNMTHFGLSFGGLTTFQPKSVMHKYALQKLKDTSHDSDSIMTLVGALVHPELNIPMGIQLTDQSFNETLSVMDSLDAYLRLIDENVPFEVHSFDPSAFSPAYNEVVKTMVPNVADIMREDFLRKDNTFVFLASKNNLKTLTEGIFSTPRNKESHPNEKEAVRYFFTRFFHNFGLMVVNHAFTFYGSVFKEESTDKIGSNIIGIIPGTRWGTSQDAPVIIGAHYDTIAHSPGLVDNASGSAVIVEVARMLSSSNCTFRNSIFILALDLEENGSQGSYMFVKDVLIKLISSAYHTSAISGVLILDCVSNWTPSPNSQEIPLHWSDRIPFASERIQRRNSTGDFVSIIYRESVDFPLARKFHYYYEGLGDPKFRIEPMPLTELNQRYPNDETLSRHLDFMRSDHARFWYPMRELPHLTFPTLLLTDTGPYRGSMMQCYHKPCDAIEFIEPSIDFQAKIATAAAYTLADLAEGVCGENELVTVPMLFEYHRRDRINSLESFFFNKNKL